MQIRSRYSILAAAMTVLIVMALALGSVRPVQAAEIRNSGTLNAGETIDDDLILSGNQVQIDGTVNGMLLASGQTVTLTGIIHGDAVLFGQNVVVSEKAVITGNLFTGAQTVTVNGQVDGSIAAGAASLVLGGKVGRNLYFGGYSLETQPSNAVARGLYFGGYQAILKGSIAQDLNASAGALQLEGSVGGKAQIDVAPPGQDMQPAYFGPYGQQLPPSIPSGLRVGPNAKIGGQLVYTSQTNQDKAVQAAPAGGIVYQTPVPTQSPNRPVSALQPVMPLLNWVFNFLRGLITLLLLGLLAVWLLPLISHGAIDIARAKPLQSAGYGFLTVIAGYAGAFVAALLILALGLFFTLVTLGGLSQTVFSIGFSGLTLLVTAFTLLVSYASKLVIAYLLGDLILAATAPALTGRRYWAMVLGVFLYSLLRAIPFLGFVIGVIATLVGMGALWLYYRAWRARTPAGEPGMSIEPAI